MAKKFDIMVYDQDSTVHPQKEYGVMAGSAQELMNMYKMCGQRIEIIKTYEDEESKNYGNIKNVDTSNVVFDNGNNEVGASTGLIKMSENDMKNLDILKNQGKNVIQQTQNQPPKTQQPTQFFTIGGVNCKIENGIVYQKHWISVSEEESKEIRIVSDKNNKICPLKDKHIEIMKWVQVEKEKTN